MARTLSERMKDWRWWGEQLAHILLGGATAAFTLIGNPIGACTAAAAWLGFWREYEQRPIQSWGDTIFDWSCTTLGGLVLGIVIWLVA